MRNTASPVWLVETENRRVVTGRSATPLYANWPWPPGLRPEEAPCGHRAWTSSCSWPLGQRSHAANLRPTRGRWPWRRTQRRRSLATSSRRALAMSLRRCTPPLRSPWCCLAFAFPILRGQPMSSRDSSVNVWSGEGRASGAARSPRAQTPGAVRGGHVPGGDRARRSPCDGS